MTLGERIKILQEEQGVSNKVIAELLHVADNTVSGYVRDKSEMTFESLMKIAGLFHVTTDYLLGLTDDPNPPYPVSTGERAMLESFRTLNREQKELIVQNIELMRRQNQR